MTGYVIKKTADLLDKYIDKDFSSSDELSMQIKQSSKITKKKIQKRKKSVAARKKKKSFKKPKKKLSIRKPKKKQSSRKP